MESEPQPAETVSLTILGQPVELTGPAKIVATSGRQMTISTELVAEPGSAVQLQSTDFIILAEVLTKQATPGTLVLQIRHVLQTDAIAYIRQQWS